MINDVRFFGLGSESVTFGALLLVALGFVLATANGANDVSKGIATLVGSGVASYRRAVLWGALWTLAGGLLGSVVAKAMVSTFGNGLLADGALPSLAAAIASLLGAALWVLLATATGLPVSTTHAIVGSLAGVAALAYGVEGVRWGSLAARIALPLLVSPVAALALVLVLLRIRGARSDAKDEAVDCVCAELRPVALSLRGAATSGEVAMMQALPELRLFGGTSQECARERPRAARISLDRLHWLTSGATSLARAMNDAPKVAALVIAAAALGAPLPVSVPALFALITAGMVLGSIVAGMRVTRVLAERVTPMDHREGFVANLVTATLVSGGAMLGLPMSTTHVTSCGIAAVGSRRGSLNRKTLRDVALAWLVTAPAAALLGAAGYLFVRQVT